MTLFRVIHHPPTARSDVLPPNMDSPPTPESALHSTCEGAGVDADQSSIAETEGTRPIQKYTITDDFKAVLDEILASPDVYGDILWDYVTKLGIETVLSYLDKPDKPPQTDSARLRKFVQDISPYVIAHELATKPEQKRRIREEALQEHSNHNDKFEIDRENVSIAEINRAIIFQREILQHLPEGHPSQVETTRKLALAYNLRYEKLRHLSDLEDSIKYFTCLSDRLPASEGLKRAWTSQALAQCIEQRFQQFKDVSDLTLIVDHYRKALRLLPVGNEAVVGSYVRLISALEQRFQLLGDERDRKEAEEVHTEGLVISKDALDRASPEDSDYNHRLADRILILKIPFQQSGDTTNSDRPLYTPKYIVKCLPSTAPLNARLQAIAQVSSSLSDQFTQSGELHYMDEALSFEEELLKMARSTGHELLPQILARLGVLRRQRFSQSGDMADLDKAIGYHRELTQPQFFDKEEDSGKVCFLICLSNVLCTRFQHLRDMSDMDGALNHVLKATKLAPPSSNWYGSVLTQLAGTISMLCERRFGEKELSNHFVTLLDMAVEFMEEALAVASRNHIFHYLALINLAMVVRTRARLLGSLDGINRAVELFRAVLESSCDPIRSRGTHLYNLANALHDRYRLTREVSDLEEAISSFCQAEAEFPYEGTLQGEITAALAMAYYDRVTARLDIGDIDKALNSFERTTNNPGTATLFRFEIACKWASDARLLSHSSTLRAYTTALSLLSRYVTTSHTIETQHARLTAVSNSLASNAASWAIRQGRLETAVELLEQGRAVLWSQVGRYRTPLDQLAEINPVLTNEFRRLSSLLEQGIVSSQNTPVGDASGYRSLSKQWDSIVDAIRVLGGFSDFLKSTPFSTLQKAAANGPVVIINHDTHRSDAIIVQYTGPPILIPLPLATPDVISSLSANLATALKLDGEGSAKMKSFQVTGVLRQLWRTVVHPVVDKIKFTCGLPVGSRIWWCPTSSLWSLPLHAAGPYKKGERNLPDIFISSYTPTLASLLQSLVPKKDASVHRAPTVLVVAQPQTPGMVSLLNVTNEVHQVKENVPSFSLLDGETATCSMVLSGLKQCPWAHFACHGLQDSHRPFNSSFALHDKHLPLLDIIQTELRTAEFAFLSACHSAAGDRTTPDEVIHLAAGLQFSGFGGVVGTMWAMQDVDGPVVAREFYRYMFRNAERGADYRDAAVALNKATKVLRRKHVPVDRWVNFIHVGA